MNMHVSAKMGRRSKKGTRQRVQRHPAPDPQVRRHNVHLQVPCDGSTQVRR